MVVLDSVVLLSDEELLPFGLASVDESLERLETVALAEGRATERVVALGLGFEGVEVGDTLALAVGDAEGLIIGVAVTEAVAIGEGLIAGEKPGAAVALVEAP